MEIKKFTSRRIRKHHEISIDTVSIVRIDNMNNRPYTFTSVRQRNYKIPDNPSYSPLRRADWYSCRIKLNLQADESRRNKQQRGRGKSKLETLARDVQGSSHHIVVYYY